MTREEAISLLSQVNHILVNSNSWLENTHEPLNIAFDMAIKALEQEPCEDAVSRANVFRIMGNLMSIPYDLDRPITEKDVSESMDEVRALLPVTLTEFADRCRECPLMGTDGNRQIMQIPPADAIPIPEGATNGDMIKAMFPNIQWDNECNGVFYGYKTNDRMMPMLGADFNWWNAPYKKGESE